MTVAPPDNDVLWARALVTSYRKPGGRTDAAGSPALRGVSLGVADGEFLAVTGPRGSGKSTLLHCLSGQLVPDEGEVWFHSRPVHALPEAERERLRRERFGWIATEPHLVPELTARENVALPLLLSGVPRRAAKATALEWLDRLDAAAHADLRPDRLSQASRQRVAVARALVTRPSVLFADEPTAPLLYQTDRVQVLRTLVAVCRSSGIAVVMATSDEEVAEQADRTVALREGRRSGGESRRPAKPGAAVPASATTPLPKSADRCSASA